MMNTVLSRLRETLHLSQREAAKRAHVSHIQWAQVEAGARKSFSTEGWLKIWDAFASELQLLGYSCEDLLRGRKRAGRKRAT